MQLLNQQRMEAAAFDTSRLVDFMERVLFSGAASQLTPLVCESGRLVITNLRIYFQPLHNVTGDSPVRVHALADVAAVARRRSSLKPTGIIPLNPSFSCMFVDALCVQAICWISSTTVVQYWPEFLPYLYLH